MAHVCVAEDTQAVGSAPFLGGSPTFAWPQFLIFVACSWCFGLENVESRCKPPHCFLYLHRAKIIEITSSRAILGNHCDAEDSSYCCGFVLFVLLHNGLIRTHALTLAFRGGGMRHSWCASCLSGDACNYAQTCNRLSLQCTVVPRKRGVLLPARCHASATHKVAWASPGVTIPFERLL